MKVSILIVNYNVGDRVLRCIESIIQSKLNLTFEIIVVENGREDLNKKLKRKFSFVKYVKSYKNLGYGAGNNLASKYATGEYLFILNPDTVIYEKSIEELIKFIDKNRSAGIVSPLLLDKNNESFSTQSKKELTPLNAFYSFSFFRKLFRSKSIYKDKDFSNWDKKTPLEVEAVPGAALLISKKLFNTIKGFDESFFLYFEENDLSKRVKKLGYKLYVVPTSKIIHEVGQSTKQIQANTIFEKSRFLFLKKHYGLTKALITETFIRFNPFLSAILLFSSSFFPTPIL